MTHEDPTVVVARIRAELLLLEEVLSRAASAAQAIDDPSRASLAVDSAALNVHDLYVGIERLCEAIGDNVDRSLPDGRHWHRDLLQQMTLPLEGRRPQVLSGETQEELLRLLGFRHVVRNVYAYQLRAGDVIANVRRAEQVFPRLRDELLAFAAWLQSIDPE